MRRTLKIRYPVVTQVLVKMGLSHTMGIMSNRGNAHKVIPPNGDGGGGRGSQNQAPKGGSIGFLSPKIFPNVVL